MKKWVLRVFPAVAAVAAGGFHAWFAALASAFLLIVLADTARRGGKLKLYRNGTALALGLLLLGYGFSVLWAADRGMAGYGFVKFLPVALYALALQQGEPEQGKDVLRFTPWVGAGISVLTFFLQFVPVLSGYVRIDGRLTGTFQYANTYALYLLIGCAALLFDRGAGRWTLPLLAVLTFGIFASGSRTSLLLLLAMLAVFCVRSRDRRYFAGLAASLVTAAAVAALLAHFGVIDAARFLTVFSAPSTLLERLLYCKDALPVIVSHPFGLGYLGYNALQSGIQTGVYSTRFVHNELLQLLLDVGVLPAAAFAAALLRGVFRKGKDLLSRATLLLILLHAMMDFDLQFLSIWLLLLPAMDLWEGREAALKNWKAAAIPCAALTALCLWMGVGDGLYRLGAVKPCLRVTPFYTEAWTRELENAATVEELAFAADRIDALNAYSAAAHNAKGDAAYSKGDITGMILEKEKALSLAPYRTAYYADYFDKLWEVMERYRSTGDTGSADLCAELLRALPERLERVRSRTDPLAWKLKHPPELTLPADCTERLRALGEK